MKQMKQFLNMAAIVLVGAMMSISCADGNDFTDEPPQPKIETNHTVTLTTTISLGGSSATRALDASGQKTFAAGDLVAVIYKDIYDQTQEAVSTALTGIGTDISEDGKMATISVTLSDPAANGQLRLIYPAAMAKASIATDADIDDDSTIDFDALATQDGTLASLAASLDLTTYDGHLTATAELPSNPKLSNRLAIGEFTIKNADGSTNITNTIKSLTVTDGTNTYTVTPAAPATGFGDGPIYVAMKPVSDDKTLTFTTAVGNKNNSKTVTAKSLEAGNMYPVGLKFGSSRSYYSGMEAQNGDIITSGESTGYFTVADGATITLDGLHISYAGNDYDYSNPYGGHAGVHLLGSATIILKNYNEIKMIYGSVYPAVYVPQGSTLTIKGNGDLRAYGADVRVGYEGGAGIGGGNKYNNKAVNCGNIVIDGGYVNAYGGNDAAGIGSGQEGTCGTITINGGYIEAHGGGGSAGIGGGDGGRCGTININAVNEMSIRAYKGSGGYCHVGYYLGYDDKGTVNIASSVNTNYPSNSDESCYFWYWNY